MKPAALSLLLLAFPVVDARADVLSGLADICITALEAGDLSGFDHVAQEIRKRKDVSNAEARKRAEECLSRGYGQPWEYWFPGQRWEPSADVQARQRATEATKQAEADADAAAARTEADRQANAVRVAAVVHASCIDLAREDLRAAMTNSVCVDSFLANGLPADLGP
jgi:hypothetical protein